LKQKVSEQVTFGCIHIEESPMSTGLTNNGMQRTEQRAAADAGRYAYREEAGVA